MRGAEIEFSALNLDEEDPNSILNTVPVDFRQRIKSIPEKIMALSPDELKKQVSPSRILEALRFSFWIEYTRTVTQGKVKMHMANVYGGVCSAHYFSHTVINTPLFLAWVLLPPTGYVACLKAILSTTTERLYDLVAAPIINEETKEVDYELAKLVLKVHEVVDHRLHGGITQRLETRSTNINIQKNVGEMTEDDLNRKIAELRAREKKLVGGTNGRDKPNPVGEVIEVKAFRSEEEGT